MRKDKEDFEEIANNIVTLGKWYNIKVGLTMKDDILPERFFTESVGSGCSICKPVSKIEYKKEIRKYYALRNWNEEGVPNFHPNL